jgi:hypothetical protein
MRSVAKYLETAVEFDELASLISEAVLKTHYAHLAECYRLLAGERRRLIETDALSPK